LIILGGVWFFSGHPLQVEFNSAALLPSFTQATNWVALIAMIASFLGMELAGVHVNDIKNPQRNFPKAVLYSSTFILVSMVLGSLAVAVVVPEKQISLVAGVIQVFDAMFSSFGLTFLTPVLALLIVVGSIGGLTNWLTAPAKGLMHAAEFGYMPAFFMRKNKHGVAHNILLGQAVVVTVLSSIYLLVPTVNAFYWFLTALSTELYLIMYILMFSAALRLHHTYTDRPKAFKIPGNHWGIWITCLLGFIGCTSTIIVSFFPPSNIDVGTSARYVSMIGAGNILAIAPVLLFFLYKKSKAQKHS